MELILVDVVNWVSQCCEAVSVIEVVSTMPIAVPTTLISLITSARPSFGPSLGGRKGFCETERCVVAIVSQCHNPVLRPAAALTLSNVSSKIQAP